MNVKPGIRYETACSNADSYVCL